MCGITGYVGKLDALKVVINGIKRLEYRGYDSSGMACLIDGRIEAVKRVGKVAALEESLPSDVEPHTAIAHTRWATHGVPSEVNAHPQFDQNLECAVVHNGIIENHEAMRAYLQERGVSFLSETDSEVIAQLIGFLYKGDILKATQEALALLKGAYAIVVMHKNHPGELTCAAKESPLAIGTSESGTFIASDSSAFLKHTQWVTFLHSQEVASVTAQGVQVYDALMQPIDKEFLELEHELADVDKGDYQHFMLKEIHEQTQTVQNALLSRYSMEYGTATLDGLLISDEQLHQVERIVILACGTSYHAGMIAANMIEDWARIPVEVEISSEYRYRNPIVKPNTLAVVISQSGETADTLAAMRELKEKGATIVGVCNVLGSTLAREVDSCLFLRAGPEIGVASTKAFTSQLVVLSLFALKLARMHDLSSARGKRILNAMTHLPYQVSEVLIKESEIAELAHKYAEYHNFFFLGRRYMYPTALEGALKLKEIAYVNANGYAAGEMKHGPISLIDEKCPTIAFCADLATFGKMEGNLREIKARSGRVLAVLSEGELAVADDLFYVPKTCDEFAPILCTVFAQIFAYHVAKWHGADIDQPRNLAKSVTVE